MTSERSFVVLYETTDNSPIGEPWPPVGDDFNWHAIRYERGQTRWRRVVLRVESATSNIIREPPW